MEHTTKKECVFEREFAYEPNEQEIADVLIDWNKKNVFASVVKNYRLVEVQKMKTETNELTHDKECMHCEKFFDCEGKPKNVDRCIEFKERKNNDTN